MGKRHNRKRTRSRPRQRDAGKAHSTHGRNLSMDTNASILTINSSFQPSHVLPIAMRTANHWDNMYSAWQNRAYYEQQQQQALEAQRLRYFGGETGDEVSLLEPMLKVVTDLFDGDIDYEDP